MSAEPSWEDWDDPINIDSTPRHARTLIDTLMHDGPASKAEICEWLDWTPGRFDGALAYARRYICPAIEATIPHPIPEEGWRYQLTDQWGPVQAGAAHNLGHAEARLRAVQRDVHIVLPHIDRDEEPLAWRRANFLNKHLDHLLRTLDEINGTR